MPVPNAVKSRGPCGFISGQVASPILARQPRGLECGSPGTTQPDSPLQTLCSFNADSHRPGKGPDARLWISRGLGLGHASGIPAGVFATCWEMLGTPWGTLPMPAWPIRNVRLLSVSKRSTIPSRGHARRMASPPGIRGRSNGGWRVANHQRPSKCVSDTRKPAELAARRSTKGRSTLPNFGRTALLRRVPSSYRQKSAPAMTQCDNRMKVSIPAGPHNLATALGRLSCGTGSGGEPILTGRPR